MPPLRSAPGAAQRVAPLLGLLALPLASGAASPARAPLRAPSRAPVRGAAVRQPSARGARTGGDTTSTTASPSAAAAPDTVNRRPQLSVDVAVTNAFVWRGVTNVNRPVVDPELTLSFPRAWGALTVGYWGNLEPARYRGASVISSYGGAAGPPLTMHEVWVEGSRELSRFGGGTLTAGVTNYLYPQTADLARDYQTSEVYASFASAAPLAPTLAVWHDVRKVRGTYAEASVAQSLPVGALRGVGRLIGRARTLDLSAAVGMNAGMGERADGSQSAYFARSGVTHVELGASTAIAAGAVTLAPTVHVILARDEWARHTTPDALHRTKAWLGVSVQWSGAVTPRPLAPLGARRLAAVQLPPLVVNLAALEAEERGGR